MAAAGQPDIKERLLAGHAIGDMTYKVHLDGHDQSQYLAGKQASAHKSFFYFSDDGDLLALQARSLEGSFHGPERQKHGYVADQV